MEKKCLQTVETANFVHSSGKAWNLMLKVGTDLNTATSPKNQISANDVAAWLSWISKVPRDENFVRSTKSGLHRHNCLSRFLIGRPKLKLCCVLYEKAVGFEFTQNYSKMSD
jgi:hypothetical protein